MTTHFPATLPLSHFLCTFWPEHFPRWFNSVRFDSDNIFTTFLPPFFYFCFSTFLTTTDYWPSLTWLGLTANLISITGSAAACRFLFPSLHFCLLQIADRCCWRRRQRAVGRMSLNRSVLGNFIRWFHFCSWWAPCSLTTTTPDFYWCKRNYEWQHLICAAAIACEQAHTHSSVTAAEFPWSANSRSLFVAATALSLLLVVCKSVNVVSCVLLYDECCTPNLTHSRTHVCLSVKWNWASGMCFLKPTACLNSKIAHCFEEVKGESH